MLTILQPLVVLLTILGASDGQSVGNCVYSQRIATGKKYYIYNENYPQKYQGGYGCRWIVQADSPIVLTCNPFDIPQSDRCAEASLAIADGDNPSRVYCGTGNFTLTSTSNKLTLTFTSSTSAKAGKFLCTVETQISTPDTCRCGWKNPTRIVGGQETGVNEYPMMAGLVDREKKQVICGATIISEKQALTAAHCIGTKKPYDFVLLVGEHDTSKGTETDATRLMQIDSLRLHPQYNSRFQDYDIAVITVQATIIFSQLVGPACLPFQHSPDTFAGNYVDILGWGAVEFAGRVSSTLQKITVPVITNYRCQREYANLTRRQICTQDPKKDSCQFDSGGPLLWENPSTRRIVGIGIISVGSTCAVGDPTQNTRVGAFIDWIVSQTPTGITYCKYE